MSLEKNHTKQFSLGHAALTVGAFMVIAKITALFRERVFATIFGQDQLLDSYFTAFRFPDFLTNLFVLSTLAVAFLPVYSRVKEKSENEANIFTTKIIFFGSAFLGIFCLILWLFSPILIKYTVQGFSEQAKQSTLLLVRMFCITPVIFLVSAVFSSLLNAKKRFFATSLTPVLYNIFIIIGAVYLYPIYGIKGLGYGVLMGSFVQMLVHYFFAARSGFKWVFSFSKNDASFADFFTLYLPRIFSFDLANVMLLSAGFLSAYIKEGSIAALNQSFNLQSVPIGVFAYSIALAAFPVLSEIFAKGNDAQFYSELKNITIKIMFYLIPISVQMLFLRHFIVRLVLGSGTKFDWQDTITTFTLFGIFSFSIIFQGFITLFSRAFYARHNTKTPVLINIFSIAILIPVSYFFARFWQVNGLAVAFGISACINAALLFFFIRKTAENDSFNLWDNWDKPILINFFKISFISVIGGLVCWGMLYAAAPFFNTRTALGILMQSGVAFGISTVAMFATALKFKLNDAIIIKDTFLNIYKRLEFVILE